MNYRYNQQPYPYDGNTTTERIITRYAPEPNPAYAQLANKIEEEINFFRDEALYKLLNKIGDILEAGNYTDRFDVKNSLKQFTEHMNPKNEEEQAGLAYVLTNCKLDECEPREYLRRLFDQVGFLQSPPHYPMSVRSHRPGQQTNLPNTGVHFGYIDYENHSQHNKVTLANGREHPVFAGTAFSLNEPFALEGDAKAVVFTAPEQDGDTQFTGYLKKDFHDLDTCGAETIDCIVPPAPNLPGLRTQHIGPKVAVEGIMREHMTACRVLDGDGVWSSLGKKHPITKDHTFFLDAESVHTLKAGDNGLMLLEFDPAMHNVKNGMRYPMDTKNNSRLLPLLERKKVD